MDLKLLRCFTAVAEELHFGRAAQAMDILPSALGRNIRLLEEELGVRLFVRSTRNVRLTKSGHVLLHEARLLLTHAEDAADRVRTASSSEERVYRIGAMDSAAAGLMPELLHDYRALEPDVELVLVEDKSVKLLPKLKSGALDIAFVRPPLAPRSGIKFDFLIDEPTVVALPSDHALAEKNHIVIEDLEDVPLIVPSPRNRPHSYNLTMRLFLKKGLEPLIAQQAEEKQTIVNMVRADIGAALVPYLSSRNTIDGVTYRPLVDDEGKTVAELPLAAAWAKGFSDDYREGLIKLAKDKLAQFLP